MGLISAERQALAALLDAAPSLAAVPVWPYAQAVETVQVHTCVVAVANVGPAPVAALGRTVTLEVWVLSPATESGPSDTALEDVLEDVLAVLDAGMVAWASAEPAIWRDTHPAYRIEMETLT